LTQIKITRRKKKEI
jgi:chromosome segregation ATPase